MLITLENITTGMKMTLEYDIDEPTCIERLCHMAGIVAGLSKDDIYNKITNKLNRKDPPPQEEYIISMEKFRRCLMDFEETEETRVSSFNEEEIRERPEEHLRTTATVNYEPIF